MIQLDAHLLPALPIGDQPAQLETAYRTAAKRVDDLPELPPDPWKGSTTHDGFALVVRHRDGTNYVIENKVFLLLEEAVRECKSGRELHRAKLVIGPEVKVRAD
jgi:hypothetical protein